MIKICIPQNFYLVFIFFGLLFANRTTIAFDREKEPPSRPAGMEIAVN